MTVTRMNLWRLGNDWNPTMLWYARAVRDLQTRPITDATSWTYLAAMHGFDSDLWQGYGYIEATTPLPPAAATRRDWDQCQHQSGYFLPWHRGYLAAFEAIVRDSIVKQGGPATWALPYWDYNEANNPYARTLPLALTAPSLPDGTDNPLATPYRYGDAGDGNVDIDPSQIRLGALTEKDFIGVPAGGSPGFGGIPTGCNHAGGRNGMLESEPHNNVHVEVGGQQAAPPQNVGLMSMPVTAALDPVFWLHHANIDRLWEVWLKRDPRHANPTTAAWLDGPSGPSARKFVMPDLAGNPVYYTPRDMLNTQAQNLNYVYEDTSDPLGGARPLAQRAVTLGVVAAVPPAAAGGVTQQAELVGANDAAVQLGAAPVDTRVRLDRPTTARVIRSLQSMALAGAAAREPDRVYLNLENIRSESGSGSYSVYVALPEGANPAEHPENLAGTLSLFGVRRATLADGPQAGNGLTTVFDITNIVDRLHMSQALDVEHLPVRFVPSSNAGPQQSVSVGRVSIYRQAQ
jgi:tyrosinase